MFVEIPDGAAAPLEALRRVAEAKLPQVDAMIERATLVRGWLYAASQCECPSLDDCCLFDVPS